MYADLTHEGREIVTEKDNVIIRQVLNAKVGGAVLDTTDFEGDTIYAGHLVIYDEENNVFKPMPVNEETKKYASLPAGFSYYGVVIASVRKAAPFVGVMTRGEVNSKAAYYNMDSIKTAVVKALPHIIFTHD